MGIKNIALSLWYGILSTIPIIIIFAIVIILNNINLAKLPLLEILWILIVITFTIMFYTSMYYICYIVPIFLLLHKFKLTNIFLYITLAITPLITLYFINYYEDNNPIAIFSREFRLITSLLFILLASIMSSWLWYFLKKNT